MVTKTVEESSAVFSAQPTLLLRAAVLLLLPLLLLPLNERLVALQLAKHLEGQRRELWRLQYMYEGHLTQGEDKSSKEESSKLGEAVQVAVELTGEIAHSSNCSGQGNGSGMQRALGDVYTGIDPSCITCCQQRGCHWSR